MSEWDDTPDGRPSEWWAIADINRCENQSDTPLTLTYHSHSFLVGYNFLTRHLRPFQTLWRKCFLSNGISASGAGGNRTTSTWACWTDFVFALSPSDNLVALACPTLWLRGTGSWSSCWSSPLVAESVAGWGSPWELQQQQWLLCVRMTTSLCHHPISPLPALSQEAELRSNHNNNDNNVLNYF